MDYKATREQLKPRLAEYVQRATTKAKRGGFVCPLCGNGTGKDGTGAGVFPPATMDKWKCQKCGAGGDLFDLIGAVEGITDQYEQLKRACEIFNVPTDGQAQPATRKEPKAEDMEQAQTDYTAFFSQAHKDIGKTDYPQRRGFSQATIDRFNLGYVPEWRHPKTPNGKPTPRLIIPTSKYSYSARYLGEVVPEGDRRYQKAGRVPLFNGETIWTAKRPVFIVESELDAISIVQEGGEAVALGSKTNYSVLFNYLKAHQEKPEQPFIVALDNEEGTKKDTETLEKGLAELGIAFYTFNPYGECKDANELLVKDRGALQRAIDEADGIQERAEQDKREKEKAELAEYTKNSTAYYLDSFTDGIAENANTPAIPTGFDGLDDLLDGGLYEGLYIVGAITSLGKTAFTLQIADQIAQDGQDVLIFSLEMARTELMARSISRNTFILATEQEHQPSLAKTTRGITAGKRYQSYSPKEKEIIRLARNIYGAFAHHIYITEGVGDIGAQQIKEAVKKHISITGKTPVVVVDYLQILAPADIRATDKQNADKAVLELKRLSRDYKIPVIGVSSFNRQSYDDPVNLACFKETGAIEYTADVLIGLQYAGMDYTETEGDAGRKKRVRELIRSAEAKGRAGQAQSIQVKVLKNRNGSKGDTLMDFYPMFNYFEQGQ